MLVAGAAVIALPTPRWLEKVVQETPATQVFATAKITCTDGTVYYAPIVEHVVNQATLNRRISLIATRELIVETIEFYDNKHEIGPRALISGDTIDLTWTIRV